MEINIKSEVRFLWLLLLNQSRRAGIYNFFDYNAMPFSIFEVLCIWICKEVYARSF